VQFDRSHGRGDGRSHRPRSAAQVDDNRAGPGQPRRQADEQLGAAARDEHAGLDGDAEAAEFRPPEEVLERDAGGPALDHVGEVLGRRRRVEQQPRLVLGEHAPGGPQALCYPASFGRYGCYPTTSAETSVLASAPFPSAAAASAAGSGLASSDGVSRPADRRRRTISHRATAPTA
jgi:hypothetical protein